MTAITKIDRNVTRALGEAMKAALKSIEDSYGVKISAAGGSFGELTATLKFRVDVLDAAGAAAAGKANFERYAHLCGLKPEDFGATFFIKSTAYVVTGLNPNAPKFCVIAKRKYDGREFRCPARCVRPSAHSVF